jgi:hypothetical protein
MSEPRFAVDNVAQSFSKPAAASEAVKRLRAAGFHDVRVSERAGETVDDHVEPETGLVDTDFQESLVRAGFAPSDADALTRDVSAGATLVIVVAGRRTADAVRVLGGATLPAPVIEPAAAATSAPTPSVAGGLPAAAPPSVAPPVDGRTDDDGRLVRLRAEKLDVGTEVEQTEARVRREVVTEQKTITVPVRHEELVIERDGADPVRVPLDDQQTP